MNRIVLGGAIAVGTIATAGLAAFLYLTTPNSGPSTGAGCQELSLSAVDVTDPESFQTISDDYARLASDATEPDLKDNLTTLSQFYSQLAGAATGEEPITVSVQDANASTLFLENYVASCGHTEE